RLASLSSVIFWVVTTLYEPVIGVKFNRLLISSSRELVHRNSERFPFEVPQRGINRADRREQWPSLSEPVHVAINFGPDEVDPPGIKPENEIPHVLARRFNQR